MIVQKKTIWIRFEKYIDPKPHLLRRGGGEGRGSHLHVLSNFEPMYKLMHDCGQDYGAIAALKEKIT